MAEESRGPKGVNGSTKRTEIGENEVLETDTDL